jgi:hypothetical protein
MDTVKGVNAPDQSVIVILLMMLLLLAVILAAFCACLAGYWAQRKRESERVAGLGLRTDFLERPLPPFLLDRPNRWLAIKTADIGQVQEALGLHNPIPCTIPEGIGRTGDGKLFVSPPIDGWILVVGQGLPDPADDIDRVFHFMTRLSARLGAVQFFCSNRPVNHHAWIRTENGRIYRAYAWAGETLWNEGEPTAAEKELGLKCFDYGEIPSIFPFSARESHFANADKVALLAARWSLDPTAILQLGYHPHSGISGDVSSR